MSRITDAVVVTSSSSIARRLGGEFVELATDRAGGTKVFTDYVFAAAINYADPDELVTTVATAAAGVGSATLIFETELEGQQVVVFLDGKQVIHHTPPFRL